MFTNIFIQVIYQKSNESTFFAKENNETGCIIYLHLANRTLAIDSSQISMQRTQYAEKHLNRNHLLWHSSERKIL